MYKNKIVSIEFLRGILAILISFSHFYYFNYNFLYFEIISSVLVEIFFIISGFVLFPKIKYVLNSKNFYKSSLKFVLRRIIRTIPSYIILLLFTSYFLNQLLSVEFINYFFFINYFKNIDLRNDYFPIVWSLCVEEWFYILILPFFFIMNKFLKKKSNNIILVLLIWIIIFFIIKLFLINNYNVNFSELRRTTIARLDVITIGSLIYIFRKAILKISLLFHFFFLTLSVCILIFLALEKNYLLIKIYNLSFFSLMIFIFFLKSSNFFVSKPLKKISFFIGNLSYIIYLSHILIILVLNKIIFFLNLDIFQKSVTYFFFIVTFSSIFFFKIEKPILNLKKKI
jgi:peptidoglycan/LPS O-acetylase OafA/YrhL